MMDDIKSPYGNVTALMQENDDICICVTTDDGSNRYFRANNWTFFEKDKAEEVTEDDFIIMSRDIREFVAEEMRRRANNDEV